MGMAGFFGWSIVSATGTAHHGSQVASIVLSIIVLILIALPFLIRMRREA